MRFPKSKLYESIFTPIIIGLLVGFIAAIMGIGGAFILVPAMIYIIKMPTKLVPGTSLFVTIFVSVIVTFLHSFNYGSIDLFLVLMMFVGSIIGVQVGQKVGRTGFRGEPPVGGPQKEILIVGPKSIWSYYNKRKICPGIQTV